MLPTSAAEVSPKLSERINHIKDYKNHLRKYPKHIHFSSVFFKNILLVVRSERIKSTTDNNKGVTQEIDIGGAK
jgi:hypothetical protein